MMEREGCGILCTFDGTEWEKIACLRALNQFIKTNCCLRFNDILDGKRLDSPKGRVGKKSHQTCISFHEDKNIWQTVENQAFSGVGGPEF